jgi:single-stranded-DNA-specific exonuclease
VKSALLGCLKEQLKDTMNTPRFERRPLPSPETARLPLKARLLTSRGETAQEDLSIAQLPLPDGMLGLEAAAQLLAQAIENGDRICIVADYDADGATACAVALRGLRLFGAKVIYAVPNRFTEGYGLSPALFERVKLLRPGLLLTVDNGIASHDGIAAANAAGVPVIVTDHHLPGETLPPAAAIVNPNQPGCAFPSKSLAGVGVMFYVLAGLRRLYRERKDPRGDVSLVSLIDLVAVGTIADLVPLDRTNRIIVHAGLERIRARRACAGILKIFEAADRDPAKATASDLGFCVGPRINAAGRLEDAAVGIACLCTDDEDEAMRLAKSLHETNRSRKEVQASVEKEAELIAETVTAGDTYSLVVADPGWHEGVVGIVAGRLKEKYRRPSVVFTATSDECLKGSCRSIAGLHIRDALAAVDRELPGAIVRFGGHAMAAGLTLHAAQLDAFKDAFERYCRHLLRPEDLEEVVVHDGPLTAEDLNIDDASWMSKAVWGQGFPPPTFLTEGTVKAIRLLKEKHTKLTLDLDGKLVDAILFNHVLPEYEKVMVHGRLEVNEWNDRRSLQIIATHVFQSPQAHLAA